jgi:Spy/CpxP family protein refolding chaperone
MNRSKTSLLALALGVVVALCSVPALAQGPGGGSGGPGRGGPGGGRGGFGGRGRGFSILRLSPPVQARLGLDAAQKSKIDAIGKKLMSDAQGLFGGGGDREAAMTKMRGLGAKAEADAVKLLKPAQKKQYDSLKAEAANYAGFGRSGGALLAVTDLTPPQKTKLKTLATEAGAKRDKLFGGSGSGGPGGPGGGDRNGMMEKMRAMNDANTAAIKKVLTPPQQKKFDAAVTAGGRDGPGGPGGGPGRGGPGGGGPSGGGPGRGGPSGGRPSGGRA